MAIPYGYSMDGENRTIDQAAAAVVRRIFDEFTELYTHASLSEIAAALNMDGIPTKRGGRWYASTVPTQALTAGRCSWAHRRSRLRSGAWRRSGRGRPREGTNRVGIEKSHQITIWWLFHFYLPRRILRGLSLACWLLNLGNTDELGNVSIPRRALGCF